MNYVYLSIFSTLMGFLTLVEFKELDEAHFIIEERQKLHSEITVINQCSSKLLGLDVKKYEEIAKETHYLLDVGFAFNATMAVFIVILFIDSGMSCFGTFCRDCLGGK